MPRGPKVQVQPITAGAEQLLAFIEAKGWSQTHVAYLLDWSLTRLYRLISGRIEITAREAFRIQDELTDGEVPARAWTMEIGRVRRARNAK